MQMPSKMNRSLTFPYKKNVYIYDTHEKKSFDDIKQSMSDGLKKMLHLVMLLFICAACKASFVTLRHVLLKAYLQWRKFRKGCRVFSVAALEEVANTAKLLTYIMLSLFPTNFT